MNKMTFEWDPKRPLSEIDLTKLSPEVRASLYKKPENPKWYDVPEIM